MALFGPFWLQYRAQKALFGPAGPILEILISTGALSRFSPAPREKAPFSGLFEDPSRTPPPGPGPEPRPFHAHFLASGTLLLDPSGPAPQIPSSEGLLGPSF